jgi:hypothetical protein
MVFQAVLVVVEVVVVVQAGPQEQEHNLLSLEIQEHLDMVFLVDQIRTHLHILAPAVAVLEVLALKAVMEILHQEVQVEHHQSLAHLYCMQVAAAVAAVVQEAVVQVMVVQEAVVRVTMEQVKLTEAVAAVVEMGLQKAAQESEVQVVQVLLS